MLQVFSFAAVLLLSAPAFAGEGFCFGGCDSPTSAVSSYLYDASDFDFSFDSKACQKECNALAKGCRGVEVAAEKCNRSAINALTQAVRAECGTLDNPEKSSCRSVANEDQQDLLRLLKDDGGNAKDACEHWQDECRDLCDEI